MELAKLLEEHAARKAKKRLISSQNNDLWRAGFSEEQKQQLDDTHGTPDTEEINRLRPQVKCLIAIVVNLYHKAGDVLKRRKRVPVRIDAPELFGRCEGSGLEIMMATSL
ncbi:MAG: hypothetical protein U5J95_02500 [Balneolaceae bacterium]|nr:hypothetical protein [Balneolaceae bacterium]